MSGYEFPLISETNRPRGSVFTEIVSKNGLWNVPSPSPMRIVRSSLFSLRVMTSMIPSFLISITWIFVGPRPTSYDPPKPNEPFPSPRSTEISLEPQLAVRISLFESPFTSATVTAWGDDGNAIVVWEMMSKSASPLPKRRLTDMLSRFATTMSGSVSLLR